MDRIQDNDTHVCKGLNNRPECRVNLIATRKPVAAAYIKYKWVFDRFVELGVFQPADYDVNNTSILGFRLISYIVRHAFRFNDQVMKEANAIIPSYNQRHVTGFHIRISDSISDFKERARFLYRSDIPRFMHCPYVNYSTNEIIFIASDSSFAKEMIKRNVSSTVVYQKRKAVHSGNEIMSGKASMGVYSVLVDIAVFMKCDRIVGTTGSTLTYLAGAFQGSVPYYVGRNTDCYYPHYLNTTKP